MKRAIWMTAVATLAVAACAKGDNSAQQPADSTARNLTLAPTESSAAMHDVPAAGAPSNRSTSAPPRSQPPATKPSTPTRTTPAAPATRTAAAGTFVDVAIDDTISTRNTRAGATFNGSVVADVKNKAGQVVIPAGSVVHGTVVESNPAPNPRTPGSLVVTLSSITVRGTDYPLDARIDSLE